MQVAYDSRRISGAAAVAACAALAFAAAMVRRALVERTAFVYPVAFALVQTWLLWTGVGVSVHVLHTAKRTAFHAASLGRHAAFAAAVAGAAVLGGVLAFRVPQDPFAGAVFALTPAAVAVAERVVAHRRAPLRVNCALGAVAAWALMAHVARTGGVTPASVFAAVILVAATAALLVYGLALLRSTETPDVTNLLWRAAPLATLYLLPAVFLLQEAASLAGEWPGRAGAGAVFGVLFGAGMAAAGLAAQLLVVRATRVAADAAVVALLADVAAHAFSAPAYDRPMTGLNKAAVVLCVLSALVYAGVRWLEPNNPGVYDTYDPYDGVEYVGDGDDGDDGDVEMDGVGAAGPADDVFCVDDGSGGSGGDDGDGEIDEDEV